MTTTHTETEIADHTTGFFRADYHVPRTQHIETDGGTVSITVGLTESPDMPVTTVTYAAAEGWRTEHTDDGVIRFVPTTPTTDGWQEKTLLARTDTREFTNLAYPELVIIVQSALCHDSATGRSRIGLATYYLECEYTSDPLGNWRLAKAVYTALDAPVPCEVEAAMALVEFDPAALTWDGSFEVPGQNDDWIADHWPENLLDRD